ncbi:MAG: hypothetical protein QNJ47_19590 [Nostocaceae cyanobacterium]|nr:hypothetical protein [Nostocaceae cyanobacterium]
MNEIQGEMRTIQAQIDALRQERASLTTNTIQLADESPEAIAEAYRRYARENVQLSAEVKGIDDAIAALETQLRQKQVQSKALAIERRRQPVLEQIEAGRKQAQIHAERINQLSPELAQEVKALKACADELSVLYWQVYYKPFITGIKSISVPYVLYDGDVWTVVNRVV